MLALFAIITAKMQLLNCYQRQDRFSYSKERKFIRENYPVPIQQPLNEIGVI